MMSALQSDPARSIRTAVTSTKWRQEVLALVLLCSCMLIFGICKGASVPFWSDELATVHIAGAPSWHALLQRSREADLNPPLFPALVRLSFIFLGPYELGARLPSILSLTGAAIALFYFLRRRLSFTYSILGSSLLMANIEIRYYLTEARPYALLLATIFVALLAYDTAIRGAHAVLSRALLAIAIVAMLQTHLFGCIAAFAFVLAELARLSRTRKLDFWTALALLLPWMTCFTYAPILFPHGSAPVLIYGEHDRSSLARGLAFYKVMLLAPFVGLAKAALLLALIVAFLGSRARKARTFLQLPRETWILFTVLFVSPLLIVLAFHIHSPGSGFYPRYGISAVVPAVIIFTGVLDWLLNDQPLAGWALLAVACISVWRGLPYESWHPRNFRQAGLLGAPPGFDGESGIDKLCPQLPLVMNNALDFAEADDRLGPGKEERMIYVADPDEALRLEHENIGESIASMAKAFDLPHHVVPAKSFLSSHKSFLVLNRTAHHDWFLDSMREHHAQILSLGAIRFAGQSEESYYVDTGGDPPPACLK